METLKELDKLSASLLEKLPELMQDGTVYANDLLVRFIKYLVILNSVELFLASVLLFVVCMISYKWCLWIKQQDVHDNADRWFVFCLVNFVSVLFLCIPLAYFCFTRVTVIITALTVPEVAIINYFKTDK